MKKCVYILAISLCFSCKREKISFVPLTQFDSVDTAYSNNTIYTSKWLHYIINNYNDSEETLKAMDSCVRVVTKTYPKQFKNFTIIFYKASDITNVQHLKNNPRDIDRYSQDNDMMFSYDWENGKFKGRSHLHK